MRKLLGIVLAGLLLTGCTATPEPTAEPTAEPVVRDFCDVLTENSGNYLDLLDSGQVTTSAIAAYGEWADELETTTPTTTTEDVATLIAPIRQAETGAGGTLESLPVFMASNSLNRYCISENADELNG